MTAGAGRARAAAHRAVESRDGRSRRRPDATERATDLRRAMSRLKPRERELLWLAYAQGSSHREIAACLGLRTGSVKLLLFRARRRLANTAPRRTRPANRKGARHEVRMPSRTGSPRRRRGQPLAGSRRCLSFASMLPRCAICSDVVEIAVAFLEDRECAHAEAKVPAAASCGGERRSGPARKRRASPLARCWCRPSRPSAWRSSRSPSRRRPRAGCAR